MVIEVIKDQSHNHYASSQNMLQKNITNPSNVVKSLIDIYTNIYWFAW